MITSEAESNFYKETRNDETIHTNNDVRHDLFFFDDEWMCAHDDAGREQAGGIWSLVNDASECDVFDGGAAV